MERLSLEGAGCQHARLQVAACRLTESSHRVIGKAAPSLLAGDL